MSQYPFHSGHPGERHFRDMQWHQLCCPHMGNDAYTTLAFCDSCAEQGTRNRHQSKLHLSSAAATIQCVEMDKMVPLQKIKNVNQHVIVFTERYIKLARALSVTTVAMTNAATIFVDTWVIWGGTSNYLLTNHRPQFPSNLSAQSLLF